MMLKKITWLLTTIAILSFISCGGGSSSKEAQKMMQKMLNFVGIPTDIIVAICIDKDKNGVCGTTEVQAKITLNQSDNFDDIWAKLALNNEGKYLLEVYDEKLPILIQIQDEAKVDFDDGKFTLTFNGFKTKENNEEKEISILQSMVDSDALSTNEADTFRTLINKDAQSKFYITLLNDLETNLNTLRVKGLDNQNALFATIKEMADETKANQAKANRINVCGDNQTCVDREIKSLSDELIITEAESNLIVSSEENRIENEASENGQKFGKWITPSKSVCEENGGEYNKYQDNECDANGENALKICKASGAKLPNIQTLSAVITDCEGELVSVFDNTPQEYQIITDKNINNASYHSCYQKKGFNQIKSYWSSSIEEENTLNQWVIIISVGVKGYTLNTLDFSVRCIQN